ncbi:MAG: DUF2723 domain-containing protein [Planctomycetes bacterium]|nr:DUF2723 domain-containing protein [Planctomycetota bacterium]
MSAGRIWLLGFLVAGILYGATADYGPQWQDSGWQQWRILTGEIDHPAGLVVTHPLQFWLGRAALHLPFGDPSGRTTIVSVFAGAVAIANLAALGWMVTRRRSAAILPAVALMFSHTFWQHATHTESYTLVAALLTLEWICLAQRCLGGSRWWLVAATAANGLGVANHLLAGLSTPILASVWIWELRKQPDGGRGPHSCISQLLFAKLGWLVCSLPYSALVISRGLSSGDWGATLYSAVFGEFEHFVRNTHVSPRMLLLTVGFLVYNLPNLTIPLGLHAVFRRTAAPPALVRILIAYLLIHAVFAFRYSITDQFTFLFPTYFALGALASIGLADIQQKWDRARRDAPAAAPSPSGLARLVTVLAVVSSLWPPLLYEFAYRVLSSRDALGSMIAKKPYRDGYAAMLLPLGDRGGYVQKTNSVAFSLAGRDGVILVGDEMFEHALRLHQRQTPAFSGVQLVFLNEVRATNGWESLRRRLAEWLAEGKTIVLTPRDRTHPTIEPLNARWTQSGDLYKLDALEE